MKGYCVVANVISDRLLRRGAKVYIVGASGGAFPQTQVYGMARWGRRITKFINMKRLENFRATWNPHKELVLHEYSKEEAERVALWYNFYFGLMNAYSYDGSVLIKQGLPESMIKQGFTFQIGSFVANENWRIRVGVTRKAE